MDKEIRQVWERQANNQKLLTIPKKSDIKAGDFVLVHNLGMTYDDEPADLKIQTLIKVMRSTVREVESQLPNISSKYPEDGETLQKTIDYFDHMLSLEWSKIQAKYEPDFSPSAKKLEEKEEQIRGRLSQRMRKK